MDKSAWKVKAKEAKDKTFGFIRRNWKELLILGGVIGIVVYSQSSDDSEENNEITNNGYDDSFDFNPPTELDEGIVNQTRVPRNHRQRDIGGIDVTGSSLMDYEKKFLDNFSTQYDRFKGKEQTIERNDYGTSSEGKYTRHNEIKYSFPEDKMGINVNSCYRDDDDGQTGESNETIDNGRGLINFFKENKNLKMFDDVQDIVDMYPRPNDET